MLTREQLSMDMNASVEMSLRVSQSQGQQMQQQVQMQPLGSSPVMQGRGVTYPYTYGTHGQPPANATAQQHYHQQQQESASFFANGAGGEKKTIAGPYANMVPQQQQLVSPQSVFDFGGSNFDLTQQLLQLHLKNAGAAPADQEEEKSRMEFYQQRKKLHLLPRTKPLQQQGQNQEGRGQRQGHGHNTVVLQRPRVDISAVRDRLGSGNKKSNNHRSSSRKGSLFGDARPREEVLKERGGYKKPSGLRPETWHKVKKSHSSNQTYKKQTATTTTTSLPKREQQQHVQQQETTSEENKEDVTAISNPFEFLASVQSADNLASLGP
jgi:hypothetical protein